MFSAYAEEFMRSYAVANNKPSEQEAKACILPSDPTAVGGTQGARLREARLECRRCGSVRSLWFRLPSIN